MLCAIDQRLRRTRAHKASALFPLTRSDNVVSLLEDARSVYVASQFELQSRTLRELESQYFVMLCWWNPNDVQCPVCCFVLAALLCSLVPYRTAKIVSAPQVTHLLARQASRHERYIARQKERRRLFTATTCRRAIGHVGAVAHELCFSLTPNPLEIQPFMVARKIY